MNVMIECAVYQGELWSVWELLDKNGNYNREVQLQMKKASQRQELLCPDCGQPLVLCSGEIVSPYLRHYQDEACTYQMSKGEQSFLHVRALLCHVARESFPTAALTMDRKKLKYPVDILIEDLGVLYGIKYLSSAVGYEQWEEMHDYYKREEIIDIWILNANEFRTETTHVFEYMVCKTVGVCILLNPVEEIVTLKKVFRNEVNGSDDTFLKVFLLGELQFTKDAPIWAMFEQAYDEHICENKLLAEQKKINQTKMENERKGHVYRQVSDAEEFPNFFFMSALNESWELPELKKTLGNKNPRYKDMCYQAECNRWNLLEEYNQRLLAIESGNSRNQIINYLIQMLENDRRVIVWYGGEERGRTADT